MKSLSPRDTVRSLPFGASCEGGGTRFHVWAPKRSQVEVLLESGPNAGSVHELAGVADGTFSALVDAAGVGDRYRYRLDGEGPYPDPASRFQPEGVHGPSEVVDPGSFAWSDAAWQGIHLNDLLIYELHVGTFVPNGTFNQVTERLPYLRDLGITAIELMPVADFPGRRNWGYDGVALFAPARCYGRPDELRRLVNVAHGLSLGVILDVVYNHLGPDGNYLSCFSPFYFSKHHLTPWGDAVNLDGVHSDAVRELFFQNASHWVREYHIDGLRLDATHALIDERPRHFVAELTSRVRESGEGREVVLIAEDHRNLSHMVQPETAGGWGLEAVWADDFHHQVRRALAGDHEAYYAAYSGSVADLATTLRQGWFLRDPSPTRSLQSCASDASAVERQRFVICLENHDQVGNRAFGGRLHHDIDLAAYRAATVLLLCAPETPLLFMGQEFAATTPFLYFTDHEPNLGERVTAGRREEFKGFSAFTEPRVRERIPDPQAVETFERSRLNWPEVTRVPHMLILRLYRELLALRRKTISLAARDQGSFEVAAVGEGSLRLRWETSESVFVAVIQLIGCGSVQVPLLSEHVKQLLSTEDHRFAADPVPVRSAALDGAMQFHFRRPGAVILASSRNDQSEF